MSSRVVLHTGALVALERGHLAMRTTYRLAVANGYTMAVSTAVVAEWWRRGKREKERAKILRTLLVEPPSAHVAQLAGVAIGIVGAGVVDALVMAQASLHADTVYTSQLDDLERLREVFPSVQLERV